MVRIEPADDKLVVQASSTAPSGSLSQRLLRRSLASKFSVFTAALVFWVAMTILAYDARQDTFEITKGFVLFAVVLLVAGAISRFTIRLLAHPLQMLEAGITAVRNGRLEPIPVSKTGDEIEYLGESFNRMIEALSASHEELRENQALLEQRIRQRTEEMEDAMRTAQAASQAKSEFLANMSHELRTPMNGVIGMLDITLEGTLKPDEREQLEMAQRCAYSLMSLLNDILDLSKIEAGKMALEAVPFDIRVLLYDCICANEAQADRKGIQLQCELSTNVPHELIGDPLRLRQIVSNLVGNAVKFTEHGGVHIGLDAETAAPDQIELRLKVADTGSGIPADKIGCIFDKFTQADGSVSRKYGGTGLGLAITKRLVEMHHGAISVRSEPGHGTTFDVTLLCGYSEASLIADNERKEPDHESGFDPARVRILVVEDNQVNQKVVTTALRKRGFTFEVAENGQMAIEKLQTSDPFDLVLMDVQMPVMDGLEATRRIRQQNSWKDLPIIAMTAHAMNGDRERCLSAGMDDYISKPVHPAHLLEVVAQHFTVSATH